MRKRTRLAPWLLALFVLAAPGVALAALTEGGCCCPPAACPDEIEDCLPELVSQSCCDPAPAAVPASSAPGPSQPDWQAAPPLAHAPAAGPDRGARWRQCTLARAISPLGLSVVLRL